MADNDGLTVLHYSAKNGSYELVTYFADLRIYLKTKIGCNCLHIAALSGQLNLCRTLVEKRKFDVCKTNINGWIALHYSVRNGCYELFTYFADLGTDIHLKTNIGWNCLHIAALNGYLNLCKALVKKHKFDVHITDNDGWAALHFSVRNGNYELVSYFTNLGTDIHLKANISWNCLHIAGLTGHLNICKTLVDKYKIDVRMRDIDGWTAIQHFVRNGSYELITYFTDLGTDIHLKTSFGSNCLNIAALNGHLNLCKTLVEKHKFNVHMASNDGWAALHFSAENGSFDLFLYILRQGSELYSKTVNMKNVLHLSSHKGHFDISSFFALEHFKKDYKDNNSRKQHILNGNCYKSQVFYKYSTIFYMLWIMMEILTYI